jgi:hypothetical protein
MLYLIGGGTNVARFTVTAIGGLIGIVIGAIFIGFDPEAGAVVLAGNVVGYYLQPIWLQNTIAKLG